MISLASSHRFTSLDVPSHRSIVRSHSIAIVLHRIIPSHKSLRLPLSASLRLFAHSSSKFANLGDVLVIATATNSVRFACFSASRSPFVFQKRCDFCDGRNCVFSSCVRRRSDRCSCCRSSHDLAAFGIELRVAICTSSRLSRLPLLSIADPFFWTRKPKEEQKAP